MAEKHSRLAALTFKIAGVEMHAIDRLSPTDKSAIRHCVYRALAHLASSRPNDSFHVQLVFLRVADELLEAHTIPRPAYLQGHQTFEQFAGRYQDNLFPDYELPQGTAALIRQTIWELYIQGVLAPATKKPGDRYVPETWVFLDAFVFTLYGVQILTDSEDRIRVYDPDAYMANFTNASPPPDPEMMRYLGECLSVFRGGHCLATVVLLAVASERLIEVLAEKLTDALGERGTDWYQRQFANRRDISKRFETLTGKLMGEYGSELDQGKLKEGFDRVVTLSFEAIRLCRNDIAHLAKREFTWNEVSGLLHNFVQYFLYVNRIIALLAASPKTK